MQEMHQWEEGLLEYMVENDIDYVEGRDIYLDEGLGKLLRGVAGNAMPALKAGYRRIKKGGKWILEKIKKPKKGADAADSATPSKGMPGTGPSSKAKPKKPAEASGTTPTPKKKPAEAVGTTPTPRKKPSIRKAVGNTAKAAAGAGAIYAGVKGYQHLKNKGNDTSNKPETSSPGSSSPGSSSPGGGGLTKPGGSGPKPTPSSQTTQNPKQRAKNRSSWNKPVGRREHIAANNRSIRREEASIIRDLTADLFEGLPEPKVNYLKDMDPYDPRRAPRDHAPGAPLPPKDLRPGIPDFLIKRASKDKKKDKKTT